MTDKLKPEQRRMVAEACLPALTWSATDNGSVRASARISAWWPKSSPGDWKALVRWLAKDIRKCGDMTDCLCLADAIATDNTEALERMALEVLEAQGESDNQYHPLDNVEDWSGMP